MPREIVLRPNGKLTAAWLERIKVKDGTFYEGSRVVAEDASRLTVKDSDVRGLELRISATDARSWAVSRRIDVDGESRQRRFTLKDSAKFTLAEARKEGMALNVRLDKGADPNAEKKAKRLQAKLARAGIGQTVTLQRLLDDYGELRGYAQKSWDERRRHIERTFKELLSVPVEAIEEQALWRVLDMAEKRGAKVSGWHGLRYLRAVLKWAMGRKKITVDPTAGLPIKDIRRDMGEGQRRRALSADELRRLWQVWELNGENVYSQMFRFAVLTGQRSGEISGLKWVDLDLERAEWRQEVNKSDRPHVVPLSAPALAIIQAKPQRRATPFVFTTSAGGRIDRRTANWSYAVTRYSAASGVRGWCAHDLRRSAATILAEQGVESIAVEQLLNHSEGAGKGGQVAAIYNRASYEPAKRRAVEALARFISSLFEGEPPKVVTLKAS